MRRFGVWNVALAVGFLGVGVGLEAAPAAPSYHGVQQTIDEIRQAWTKNGTPAGPNAPGWNAFFDALQGEFRTYSAAPTDNDRLVSLNRLYQMSVALNGVNWAPAERVRDALRNWLRPRVRLAWAERQLVERVQNLGETADPALKSNRERWLQFVGDDLGAALRHYDAAGTVLQRQEALKKVYGALNSLQTNNQTRPWVPSVALQQALNDLYNQPNLDISADLATVAPALEREVVQPGPIFFKGYWSYVTPGPKSGFGLLPSDDGIAFYNRQWMTSVTPVTDFQNQIEKDPKGRRAAKMYHFDDTNTDQAEVIITVVVRDSGMQVSPNYNHNVDAAITSQPQPGGGFGRMVAGLIGMNQAKITQKVYEGAIGEIRSGVVESAMELGQQKANEAAAEQNVKLREYLPGNRTLAIRNLLITGLNLRSRPENALMGGTLQWNGAGDQVGADAPQPAAFAVPDRGVSADLHLTSMLTSLTRGYLQSENAREVKNLLVVTRKIPPNAPPSEGILLSRNADYPAFLKAVEAARAANDPKVLAIRVKRPGHSPEFAADARGFLVAIVHDFMIEVPAPPAAEKGGVAGPPAQVYRVTSPDAEFVISFKVTPQTEKEPVRLTGRIESFDPGPQAKVFAVNEDENKPTQLTTFASVFVLGIFRTKLQGQPIDVPLSNLQLRGFAIESVSPLDPSGWIRANLVRTSESPAAGVN